jgi:hypothetical protein
MIIRDDEGYLSRYVLCYWNKDEISRVEHKQWIGRTHMKESSSSVPPLSKKQQEKRARAEAKQQKRQERALKKRLQRGKQRAHMHEALRKMGAKLEKGGKQKGASGRRAYTINWRGREYHFDALREISQWAKQMQNPPSLDYAELEIDRLIEQAWREMSE